MKAVRCPVCAGTGTYWEQNEESSPSTGYYRKCHGCDGRGWVEVRGDTDSNTLIIPPITIGTTTLIPNITVTYSNIAVTLP